MTTDLIPAPASGPLARQRIDPDRLRANMARFAENRMSANTRRTYAAQWRVFSEWCAVNGLQALPADEATAATYVEHLYDAGKSRATIDVARAAIGKAHADAGERDPFAGLGDFMRAVVRTLAGEGRTAPRVIGAPVPMPAPVAALVVVPEPQPVESLADEFARHAVRERAQR